MSRENTGIFVNMGNPKESINNLLEDPIDKLLEKIIDKTIWLKDSKVAGYNINIQKPNLFLHQQWLQSII